MTLNGELVDAARNGDVNVLAALLTDIQTGCTPESKTVRMVAAHRDGDGMALIPSTITGGGT